MGGERWLLVALEIGNGLSRPEMEMWMPWAAAGGEWRMNDGSDVGTGKARYEMMMVTKTIAGKRKRRSGGR